MNDTDELAVPTTASTSETIVINSLREKFNELGMRFSNIDTDRPQPKEEKAIIEVMGATGIDRERIIQIIKSCQPQPHSD